MAVVNGTIAANGDNGMVYYTGAAWDGQNTGDVHWFGINAAQPELGFIRFVLDAAIPDDSTISSAILTMESNGDAAVGDAWFYVEAAADAAAWANAGDRPTWAGTGNTTTYPTTQEGTGATHWTGTWPAAGVTAQIDIKTLIQGLVDAYSGLASAAHVFVWFCGDAALGTSENGFRSRSEGSPATLVITYTAGGGATNVVQMII